ncbi:sialate O-acetylesterase [Haloferula sp.]|uniref:sialate O-acetylesterase n=1 Tax=Haloferula sp. TaxID=2497595 RepID=UPI0032A06561
MKHHSLITIFGIALANQALALELELPTVLSDHMILQREQAVPIWGKADAGATVGVIFADQKKQAVAGADGTWRIDLDAMPASAEPRAMSIAAVLNGERASMKINDVLVGEVWFAGGQSNMYRPFRMLVGKAVESQYEPIAEYLRKEAATANDPLFRQFRAGKIVSPSEESFTGRGSWSKAVPGDVNEFCGTSYFFGRELRQKLDVPVAIIACNLGATRIEPWIAPASFPKGEFEDGLKSLKERLDGWDDDAEREKYKQAMAKWEQSKKGKAPTKPEDPAQDKQLRGALYNGMVRPIIPYAIKGAIWYQGESNTKHNPAQYGERLTALIDGWRSAWGQEHLYFYWCELASYKQAPDEPVRDEHGHAVLRFSMQDALTLPDTGMAVLLDIGEARDVHPKNKVDAGKRLSLWALKQAYGKDLVSSGPLFKDARVSGKQMEITFDHAGSGLMVGHKHLLEPTKEVDEPLKRFRIRGADEKWKWAEAKITGKDTIVVWHDEIPKPVEVRYAWSANPEGANLYNKERLPASGFKTAD